MHSRSECTPIGDYIYKNMSKWSNVFAYSAELAAHVFDLRFQTKLKTAPNHWNRHKKLSLKLNWSSVKFCWIVFFYKLPRQYQLENQNLISILILNRFAVVSLVQYTSIKFSIPHSENFMRSSKSEMTMVIDELKQLPCGRPVFLYHAWMTSCNLLNHLL